MLALIWMRASQIACQIILARVILIDVYDSDLKKKKKIGGGGRDLIGILSWYMSGKIISEIFSGSSATINR